MSDAVSVKVGGGEKKKIKEVKKEKTRDPGPRPPVNLKKKKKQRRSANSRPREHKKKKRPRNRPGPQTKKVTNAGPVLAGVSQKPQKKKTPAGRCGVSERPSTRRNHQTWRRRRGPRVHPPRKKKKKGQPAPASMRGKPAKKQP